MALKAILLPDSKTSIAVSQIARVQAYPNGVGFFNIRERMIGWIECSDETANALMVGELNGIVNNPNRAKHPDWAALKEVNKAA